MARQTVKKPLKGSECWAAASLASFVGTGVWSALPAMVDNQIWSTVGLSTKDRYVRSGLPRPDRGAVRRDQPSAEVGIVSIDNVVGLILAVFTALLLAAALVFPERF